MRANVRRTRCRARSIIIVIHRIPQRTGAEEPDRRAVGHAPEDDLAPRVGLGERAGRPVGIEQQEPVPPEDARARQAGGVDDARRSRAQVDSSTSTALASGRQSARAT